MIVSTLNLNIGNSEWGYKPERQSEIITIYFLFIGISRESRKFPVLFDFTISSKNVILFHFESNQKSSKKKGKIRKY